MRVAVVGGGPAGLYFSALWKRRHPADEVRLIEQNAADATWGFGVVFSDQALEFLRDDDPETVAAIAPRMQAWRDIAIVHRGERVVIDGVGFSAIGRLDLLRLLQQRAREAGVDLRFGVQLASLDELGAQDLIVAADGVNSLVRRTFEREFGLTSGACGSKFAWYGTTKPFDTLTQTFVANELGTFNAHHYRYAPDMSTFIVECDPATWVRAGLDKVDEQESRRICEQVFEEALGGHALVSNRSIWRSFPWVCERALVLPQLRADRRRAAHRALLDRLRHAAGAGGRAGARQGAGGRARRSRGGPRALRGEPAPDRWRSSSRPRAGRPPGTIASPSTCSSRRSISP